MENEKTSPPVQSPDSPDEAPDDINHDAVQPPKPKSKKWLWIGLALVLLLAAGAVYWFVLKDDPQPVSQTVAEPEDLGEYMKIPEFGIEVPYSLLNGADTYEIRGGGEDMVVFYNAKLFDDKVYEEKYSEVADCWDNPKSGIVRGRIGEDFPNEKYTQDSILAEINGFGYYIAEAGEDCTGGDQEVQTVMAQYVWIYDRSTAAKAFREGSTYETWIKDNISYEIPQGWSEIECSDVTPPQNLIFPPDAKDKNCDERNDLMLVDVSSVLYSGVDDPECATPQLIKELKETKGITEYECEIMQLNGYQAVKASSRNPDGRRHISYEIYKPGTSVENAQVVYYSNEEGELVNEDVTDAFVKSLKFKDE